MYIIEYHFDKILMCARAYFVHDSLIILIIVMIYIIKCKYHDKYDIDTIKKLIPLYYYNFSFVFLLSYNIYGILIFVIVIVIHYYNCHNNTHGNNNYFYIYYYYVVIMDMEQNIIFLNHNHYWTQKNVIIINIIKLLVLN